MRIVFLTTNDFGFGGSELLWIKTAIHMAKGPHQVAASVKRWSPAPVLISDLESSMVEMLWHQYPAKENDRQEIAEFQPDLVCVSTGYHLEGLDWLEWLAEEKIPFAIIFHAVHELGFTQLNQANFPKYRKIHAMARWLYFVSVGNKRLYERMLGVRLAANTSSIVRNPYSVPYQSLCASKWPNQDILNLAIVGRIECYHKGYDLLPESFKNGRWNNRPFRLNVYGDGPHKELITRLWETNDLDPEKLVFHGHVTDIEEIWKINHILIQPSRLEGLPISVVEASICGRPTLATDVAGHTEIIENFESGFIAAAPIVSFVEKALEAMWEHRAQLFSMGKRARAIAEAIVPQNPEFEFEKSLLSLMTSGYAQSNSAYPNSDSANACDGHAFKTIGGGQKLEIPFDKNTDATITLSNCRGTIRFDPTTAPAIIQLKSIAISIDESPEFVIPIARLKSLLSVKGTATRLKRKRSGYWIESTGDDPNILFHGELLARENAYNLRVIIHVH